MRREDEFETFESRSFWNRLSPKAKLQLIAWSIPVALLLVYLGRNFLFVSDSLKIERLIGKGERAFEREDAEGCLSLTAPEFVIRPGEVSVDDLEGFKMEDLFRQFDEISLHIENFEAQFGREGSVKTADVRFDLSGRLRWNDQFVPISRTMDGPAEIRMKWRKEPGGWKAVVLQLPVELP